jgi:hypothetical protein
MIGKTFKACVVDATTRNITMTDRRPGQGYKKVFDWGNRPAGQFCARTREIR